MPKLIKQYFFPALETVSTLGLAVTTIMVGAWASAKATTSSSALLDTAIAFWQTKFDPSTPVPYFFGFLILSVVGRVEGVINRYQLGKLQEAGDTITSLKAALREETQAHSTSKTSYLSTLESALKYLLTSSETGFDHRCRVTIYRKQESSENTLRQIFRHSPNHNFDQNGRISVPVNEGVVGAAWSNHGEKEVIIDHDPTSDIFRSKMHSEINPDGCCVPEGPLSMPSRHYFARKFEDHESGNRIGIVVYECTEANVLSSDGMRNVLSGDALNVSRLIQHLGVLRSEFNPAPSNREE